MLFEGTFGRDIVNFSKMFFWLTIVLLAKCKLEFLELLSHFVADR